MKLEPYTKIDKAITFSKRFIAECQSVLNDINGKYAKHDPDLLNISKAHIEECLKDEQEKLQYFKASKTLNKGE